MRMGLRAAKPKTMPLANQHASTVVTTWAVARVSGNSSVWGGLAQKGKFIRTDSRSAAHGILCHTAVVFFDCLLWRLQIVVACQAAHGFGAIKSAGKGEAAFSQVVARSGSL